MRCRYHLLGRCLGSDLAWLLMYSLMWHIGHQLSRPADSSVTLLPLKVSPWAATLDWKP